MPLPAPKLDDRNFAQLMADAMGVIDASCPEWTDRNPADPGMTLLEAFAFLTEAMLYRLNRVPPKLYVTLLNLIGVRLRAPSAAMVELTFSRTDPSDQAVIQIPAGTRVSTGDGSVEFVVIRTLSLGKTDREIQGPALHCVLVEGERLGAGTGAPGLALTVARGPVVGPSGDGLDMIVGVEAAVDEAAGAPSRGFGGKSYRIWREVETFADAGADETVYTLDRVSGRIQFGPGGTGLAVPSTGREIRAWYRQGGGTGGNVAAGTLKTLRDPVGKVSVTNRQRAAGGADAETVEAAMARGPLALTSMRCAVTGRDFERVALSVGGVARARAYAQAQVWRHADPGVVEVLVVPQIAATDRQNGAITAEIVQASRQDAVRQRVESALEARRPLAVRTVVKWARVRPVETSARIVVGREVDPAMVEHGLIQRLNTLLSPLRDHPFGRELRVSDVYETLLAEPGVRYADQLSFAIGETPDRDVVDLLRDPHQPQAWFAVTRTSLHRTLDDGESWSSVFARDGEQPMFVCRHRDRPGLLALGVQRQGGGAVHISRDCGETWLDDRLAFKGLVRDAEWINRDGLPLLLIATDEGLSQYLLGSPAGPAPVSVDKTIDTKGFYAVTSAVSPSGVITVAVAGRGSGGIYLSPAGGVSETFRAAGLKGKDIRGLKVQSAHARDFLWAAAGAEAGEQGEGAFRLELRAGGEDDPNGFQPFNIGWQGGSCEGIAFAGDLVVAGSNRSGVLHLDSAASAPSWRTIRLDAGLPIRDTERLLHVVTAVAAIERADGSALVFSGGPMGVHRSRDGGQTFSSVSATVFTDRIPLPPDFLYCAAPHRLTMVVDDPAGGQAHG